MSEKSAIILQPNSQTNDSDKYRVTYSNDWTRFVNGATLGYAFIDFNTYEEAKKAADEMNRELHKPV
jgi:hypothetical protein